MLPVEPALSTTLLGAPLGLVPPGLQAPPVEPVPSNPVASVGGAAVSAFVTTLLVGAVLVALTPAYVERKMAAVTAGPLDAFLYGLVALVFVVLAVIVLALTGIGLVVAIPLAIVAWVLWAVGATVRVLAIADRLVGRDEGWLKPLVVAAAINGGLTLTGVGGLVAFGVGAAGFGTVVRDWLE